MNRVFIDAKKEIRSFPAKTLLIEHSQYGKVLVDTGYGPYIMSYHYKAFLYRLINPTFYKRDNSIVKQLRGDGIGVDDIQQIIVTHLHPDHIGNLRALPHIPIIMSSKAYGNIGKYHLKEAVFKEHLPSDLSERTTTYELNDQSPLKGFVGYDLWEDNSLWLIDLPGHARGHMGIYLPEKHIFYITDASWGVDLLDVNLKRIARKIQYNYHEYVTTIQKIKTLINEDDTLQILTSHGQEEVCL